MGAVHINCNYKLEKNEMNTSKIYKILLIYFTLIAWSTIKGKVYSGLRSTKDHVSIQVNEEINEEETSVTLEPDP